MTVRREKRSPRARRRGGAPVCAVSGKIRYRDGHQAALALKGLRRRAARADLDGARHSIRVRRKYLCGSCGGWHLTSQPPPESDCQIAV